MHKDLFARRPHLLSISIRLGLSLTLGILAVLLLIDVVSVAFPAPARAYPPAPGDLDTTFGTGGVVTTPIGTGDNYVYGVAIQEDGKIVAAGDASNGSDFDFALARYTVSGDLDTTFGSSGVVTTPIGLSYDNISSVTIQPDGKIVAVGSAYNGSADGFALARYHAGYSVSIYLPLVLR